MCGGVSGQQIGFPETPPVTLSLPKDLLTQPVKHHGNSRCSGGRTQEPTSVFHTACGLGQAPGPALSLSDPAGAGQLPESLLIQTLTLQDSLAIRACPPFSATPFSLDPLPLWTPFNPYYGLSLAFYGLPLPHFLPSPSSFSPSSCPPSENAKSAGFPRP